MKKTRSLGLIGASIIATSVALIPTTSPVSAQTSTTTTPTTTTTERTYDTTNNDDRGLWGLAGLVGLLGLLGGKRREDDHRRTMGDDATVYRDPSRR
jgi:hypothetical protein